MRWLKGVVLNKKDGLIQIELETGRQIWTTPSFNVGVREQIIVSWDYTHDRVNMLTTPKRLTHKETDEETAEAEAGDLIMNNDNERGDARTEKYEGEMINEDFSLPLVEEDEDEVEVEGEVFSTPKGDRAEAEDDFEIDEAHIHETGDESDIVSVHRHNINSSLL